MTGWDFTTAILYTEARGAIFHEMELVSLTGRTAFGKNPVVWTQYSSDGMTWSTEKPVSAGAPGQRDIRIAWLNQGMMRRQRLQRFRGTSDARIAPIRLEARAERLAN